MVAPTPCAQLTECAGPSKRRSHDVTRGTLKSHRTGEGPKILLLPHCSQKSSFTRYGDAPSCMLMFGSAAFSWIPHAFFLRQYGWVAFRLSGGSVNICWRSGASFSSTMGSGLLSPGCEACGYSVGVLMLLVCAEKSREGWGFCVSADFQVPFSLQQGISYYLLSGTLLPYEFEAVGFANKVFIIPET